MLLLLLDVKMAVQQKILRRNRSSSGNGGLSSYKRWSLQFPPTSCHGGSWQPEQLLASGKSSEMNSFTSSASSFSQFDRSDVLKAVFPEAAARNATAIAGDAGPASLANAISRSSGHLVRNSILFGLLNTLKKRLRKQPQTKMKTFFKQAQYFIPFHMVGSILFVVLAHEKPHPITSICINFRATIPNKMDHAMSPCKRAPKKKKVSDVAYIFV